MCHAVDFVEIALPAATILVILCQAIKVPGTPKVLSLSKSQNERVQIQTPLAYFNGRGIEV